MLFLLALKNMITILNSPGTIDSDYRGEVCAILINHGTKKFHINPKMRIAQIIFSKSGHEFVCDAIVHLSTGLTAQAKASKAEIYAAFDACAEKVEKQLRRYKRKLKGHHKDRNQSVEFIDSTSYMTLTKEGQKESATYSEPIIIAETDRKFPIFSAKEAAEELEEYK